jgi:hypothetical protein
MSTSPDRVANIDLMPSSESKFKPERQTPIITETKVENRKKHEAATIDLDVDDLEINTV